MKYSQLMIKREIEKLISDAYQNGQRDAYDQAYPEVGMPASPVGCTIQLAEFEKLWESLSD